MSETIATDRDAKERLIALALDGLPSPHTCRAYRAALDEFLTWSQGQQPSLLCKALVHRYKAMLLAKELAPATINQRLAAVRRLAQEAADNGLLEASLAASISKVRGLRRHGVRLGRWLTAAGARERDDERADARHDELFHRARREHAERIDLLRDGHRPDLGRDTRSDATGHHECGQHRTQLAHDGCGKLVGKHGRIRTVAVPFWAKTAVDEWRLAGSILAGRLFRHITKRAEVTGEGFSAQAVYDIVREHAQKVDSEVRPHDLRRSFARLAYEGHAPIEQLSLTLGHASIATTERYVAARQHFRVAPCDLLNLDISSPQCPTAPDGIARQ